MHVKTVKDLLMSLNENDKLLNKSTIIDQYVKNSYRVLLTRERETNYIYVKDAETYQHLKAVLH